MNTPVAYVLHGVQGSSPRLAHALEGAGAEVYAFASASDLALAAGADPPDVVVTDDGALADLAGSCIVISPTASSDATRDAVDAVRGLLERTFDRTGDAPTG